MTNFEQLYQEYGEYNVLFNQLNLPSPSVDYAWRKTKKIIQDRVVAIIKNGKPNLRIGDLGCGNGALIIRVSELTKQMEKRPEFWGFDMSDAFVKYGGEAAKYKKLKNLKFRKLNVETEGLPSKLDVMICSEVLEHLHNPEEILKKIYNSLNRGGYLILTTPNSQNLIKYPFSFLKKMVARQDSKELSQTLTEKEQAFVLAELEQHLYVFSSQELKKVLNRVGFSIQERPRSTTLFGGPFLDNHPIIFALTLIFDRFVDFLPIPQLGWDNIFVAKKL